MKTVTGKTAFITGGASGIGLGIAKVFAAKENMNVVIADVRQETLDNAIQWFKQRGLNALAIQLDVTNREAYTKAAEETESAFGNIHILINNAGVGAAVKIQDATYKDWDFVMGVNAGGTINGIVTILPRILAHGEGGHIVSTSSSSGIFAVNGSGIYSASKYAVTGIMEALAMDLEGTNVGASVYFPGPVRTSLPITSNTTRPEHYKNPPDPNAPPPPKFSEENPPFDMSLFMDPVEVGQRILRGIKRDDLFIMSHPEFHDGIKVRNDALIRAIPNEPPNKERHETLKMFGNLLYNPIYEKQTTPGPPDWKNDEI